MIGAAERAVLVASMASAQDWSLVVRRRNGTTWSDAWTGPGLVTPAGGGSTPVGDATFQQLAPVAVQLDPAADLRDNDIILATSPEGRTYRIEVDSVEVGTLVCLEARGRMESGTGAPS